ncbi:MaoC/PaaZ C-terminal domain-containing protein [Rhodococcus sp. T7]|uniref:MaoC/PaaZ C-terminal domain-containing protein n=1 Tax=Rhodococcus sp. T7 TaxID=627444 RepID=UPI0013575BE2|nr:hypothetical protein MLGJGCBP_09380 [Rhodococcus sp. T7]KAF0964458.1 hypothetical protein MLGJGCBP_02399 [Rhodococcus sp. T7]
MVGQRIGLGSWYLSGDEIIEFASKWDPFPFHLDREVAAVSEFGGLVASGAHVLAISRSFSSGQCSVPRK